jgi:hypothetical protein
MFKERTNPTVKIEVVKEFAPRVGITSEALTKMQVYVAECSDEIGWLGTARMNKEARTVIIDDVYLFEQDVHGATTEITPEGLTDFATELLEKGEEGIEIWNNLKMWGHSHVNMGITPSGQDNSQMKTFKEGGHDWFIRLIANKKGEMKLDLYDYETGVTYLDLPWVEIMDEESNRINQQIEVLYAQLDAHEKARLEAYQAGIKEEMKTKVRKMRTVTTTARTGYQTTANYNYANEYGYYKNGVWIRRSEKEKEEYLKAQAEKKTHKSSTKTKQETKHSGTSTTTHSTIDRKGFYKEQDLLESDDDVLQYFSDMELFELSANASLKELEEEIELFGYFNFFTDNDLERIYRVMRKVESKLMNSRSGHGYK